MSHESDSALSRRTFLKASGLVAGATLVGSTGSVAGESSASFDYEFANWRTREARKVWDRGYRGRPNRTLAITDSGIEARHPDLGPWNGIRAVEEDDEILLTRPNESTYPETERVEDIGGGSFSGQLGPGGPGSDDRVPTDRQFHEFTVPTTDSDEIDEPLDEIDASMTWTPQRQDNELILEHLVDGKWKQEAASRNFNPGSGAGESLTAQVEPGDRYRFVAETYVNAASDYEITYTYARVEVVSEGDIETADPSEVFADVPADPDAVDETTPKTVGWYNETARNGRYRRPRDGDEPRENTDEAPGHGSNGASVAAGTGRAIAVDTGRYHEAEPRATVLPGETIQYEVTARADTSVFATAYGDNIRMRIEGPDGRTLADSNVFNDPGLLDSVIADTPTVHGSGEATYTVIVIGRDAEGVGTGRLNRIAVGASLREDESDGDRTGEDGTVHAGVAPNAALFGLSGLGEPTLDVGEYADRFADLFNVRAVNMSWSYIDPAGTGLGTPPYSATGVELTDPGPSDIKKIAEGGILPVAAAANSFTPGQESTPALADEAIAVVATDALDGIVSYSSSGLVANDEDGDGTYKKPDVTAPGGDIGEGQDLIRAARRGNPEEAESDQPPIRDYAWTAGTSFSSPYVAGVSMLLSEAMEYDAPDAIALPEPAATGFDDVMRLKQALLATASETAFTAAPYHDKATAKGPRYDFGDHDIYEGWGRVNPEVAVDAVSRDLLPDLSPAGDIAPGESASVTHAETTGLNLPEDQRAFGGYVDVRGGTLEVNVDFTRYSGGNKGMTQGNPHVDLFVYDAEQPADNGTPNIVASAQGLEGSASLTVDVSRRDSRNESFNTRTLYVVGKLVNVPGVVNGYDVQAHFDVTVDYEAAGKVPLPAFTADGTRSDDGSVFTAGQTNQVDVTLETVPEALPDDAVIRIEDVSPWDVDVGFRDAEGTDGDTVDLGTTTAGAVRQSDGGVTKTYFAEAPESTGRDTFGPATAVVTTDVSDTFADSSDEFTGTDTNTVVGASTNT